jgi:hypothetical protein
MKLTGDVREMANQAQGLEEQARAFREQGGELYVNDPAAE